MSLYIKYLLHLPFVSIIIAVFNKEHYISKTLTSVLQQSYSDFEVIIVNDGSADKSEEEILKFKDSRIQYHYQENQGAGAARNKAISLAKGTYIALLDADDIWESAYLEEQLKLIEKHPLTSVYSCAIKEVKKDGTHIKPYSISNQEGVYDYFESSLQTSILHSSSTIVHKSVFDEIGYYNPNIKSGQDTDLYVRIGLKYQIAFNPKVLVSYTINSDSLWRSIQSTEDRANFEEYTAQEATNPALKKFLDINRFSLAIQAKIWGEADQFKAFIQRIDQKNLNGKQRFLLKQPQWLLQVFHKTKALLARLGLRFTVFG